MVIQHSKAFPDCQKKDVLFPTGFTTKHAKNINKNIITRCLHREKQPPWHWRGAFYVSTVLLLMIKAILLPELEAVPT